MPHDAAVGSPHLPIRPEVWAYTQTMDVVATLRRPASGYFAALASTAGITLCLAPFRDEVGLLNEGLIFLLLTLLVASIWGRGPGLLAALLTNLSLNFFFIEPHYTLTVADAKNVVALVIFLLVSVVGGSLLSAAREAAAEARQRQAETEVALSLSRAMSGQTEPDAALAALCREVTRAFASPGAAVLSGAGGRWSVLAHAGSETAARLPEPDERAAAERAVNERAVQSLGRSGLSRTRARIVAPGGRRGAYASHRSVALIPLLVGNRVIGVLRVDGPIGETPFRDNPEPLLAAIASEAALAVQRTELASAAAHAEALREADEMKTALMASISHDLKTPLASIKAAISSVLDKRVAWTEDDIDIFHQTIDSQADRLNRVISDILDLNRIEAGAMTPEQAPLSVPQLLSRAREATRLETVGREVTVDAPQDLRVIADEALITQALVNLIENAVKYSTPGGAIHLDAARGGEDIILSVADEGPGIAPQDLPYVFERFYRAEEHSRRVKGSGLGLTIVKGFVELCGGRVSVESSPAGTRFVIRLPAATAARVGT
jgi:two-component system sensor histidine kinase KdpD